MKFKDEGKSKYYYMKRVFVHCPKCNKRALIENPKLWYGTPKLKCTNCHFSQNYEKNIYTLSLKLHCPNCAFKISRRIENVKKQKEKILIRCEECGETNAYKPNYEPESWNYYGHSGIKDPYFGLEIWLHSAIKGNEFWAYNYEHLEDIKNYVSAKLRIRTSYDYQTMVEKLPKWVTSKKNRVEVLKIITRLEKKVTEA